MKNLDYARSFHTDINLKLDNITKLLEELGNPQDFLEFIQVAGTNGKGSVCAFLEEILVKDGRKTGRFSSPELLRRNETIRVDKKDIEDDALERVLLKVHNAADKLEKFPSPYEILCAAAFVYFKESDCDVVILEAGMGGEGDATNVVKNTVISVITPISLDHTAYLGDTEEEIAVVKSGIIKPGSIFVTAEKNRRFDDIFKRKTKEINYAKAFSGDEFEDIYEIICYKNERVRLSLGGIMQRENAALAVMAAEAFGADKESILYGISNAKNPARFEKINGIYFDGAHNPDGARALSESVERYMKDSFVTYVMGIMRDKDFSLMLDVLKGENRKYIFNTVKGNERAMSAEEMVLKANEKGIDAEAVSSLLEGISKAEGKIVVCGSLYMYKELL